MYLIEDEGPCPILTDCRGVILLNQEGFLQAYLMLDKVQALPDSFGDAPTRILDTKKVPGLVLAPIAELFEITRVIECLSQCRSSLVGIP
jgi:hypothetical protein